MINKPADPSNIPLNIPGENDITENSGDLIDTPEDEKQMEEKEVIFDLPDVEDIPGQENIIPPKMNFFEDTTIASDDEEGTKLFDDMSQV